MEMVVKLHGFPSTIISDRDPIFMSKFWGKLFELSGTMLKHSSAYHPQIDGQSKVVNHGLEQYLWAYVQDRSKKWHDFLCWAEYNYNTSYHSSIKMIPYQTLYGRLPPLLLPYVKDTTTIISLDKMLEDRDILLRELKVNLREARHCMEQKANKRRREVVFQVGEKVLVKLQPYHQVSVAHRASNKLAKKYYGPFVVLERIGKVAYHLELPQGSRIHPVFHVSALKKFRGDEDVPPLELPEEVLENRPVSRPSLVWDT